MNREEIIRAMRSVCDKYKVDAWQNGFWTITQEDLERFAALVAAAEREACAKVCEELGGEDSRMNKHTPEIMSFVLSKSEYERVAAQARLIAAAPDLLAALRDMVNTLTDGPDESDIARVFKVSRAAIAKAKGEKA